MAFLLLVSQQFAIPPARRLVFDPLHTEKDRQILQLCGCTPLMHNERAGRRVHCRTLFYMPFAPYDLTDNLIRANWECLDRVMIIGNSLRWVVDHRAGNDAIVSDGVRDGGDAKSNEGDPLEAAFRSRAPCVEAAICLATVKESTLWQGDLVTWTLLQAKNDSEVEAEAVATMQAATKERDGDKEEDKEEEEDEEELLSLPSEAMQRSQARYALNATLAIFTTSPQTWPQQPPQPTAVRPRSRL